MKRRRNTRREKKIEENWEEIKQIVYNALRRG